MLQSGFRIYVDPPTQKIERDRKKRRGGSRKTYTDITSWYLSIYQCVCHYSFLYFHLFFARHFVFLGVSFFIFHLSFALVYSLSKLLPLSFSCLLSISFSFIHCLLFFHAFLSLLVPFSFFYSAFFLFFFCLLYDIKGCQLTDAHQLA